MVNTGDHGGVNPEDLLAEAIVDDAVRRRRAEGWSRRRALDDVTIAATLLASVGDDVSLHVATGERLHGTVVAAGPGVVVVERNTAEHWIRTDAVIAVTPDTEQLASGVSTGDPGELASLIADQVDSDRTVTVRLTGGMALTGVVTAVGTSLVLTLPDGRRSVVELDAVLSAELGR